MGNVIKFDPRNVINNSKTKNNSSYDLSNKIICKSKTIKEMIIHSLGLSNWRYRDFVYFIEKIGLKLPINLVKIVEPPKLQSLGLIQCISGDNKIFYIECFTDGNGCNFLVTTDQEITGYTLEIKDENNPKMPAIFITDKVVYADNNKVLKMYYYGDFIFDLNIGKEYTLSIMINTKKIIDDIVEVKETPKYRKAIDYILGLTDYANVWQICADIFKIFEFTKEEIIQDISATIALTRNYGETKISIHKVSFTKNYIFQYVVTENDETYNLCSNGSWGYHKEGLFVSYSQKTNHMDFTISGCPNHVTNTNVKRTLSKINNKVQNYFQIFNENTITKKIIQKM
ncbi:MAG: hypothetical protein IKF52_05325 [Clostridia bacterium]|nr:hypothetical protein [Clostridia bacterium]